MSQSGKAVRAIIVLLFTVKILVGGCGDDRPADPDTGYSIQGSVARVSGRVVETP